MDDLLKALAIRAATYLEDQYIPYDEDVDGNDFTATHLLGFVGDEPAGCLRIRYFAGFVKFERLAVLPRFRGKLALQLIRAAIAFAQAKGYRRIYGQSAEDVTNLWRHFGFKQREGEGIQYLTDQTYYEMDLEVEAPELFLTHMSGAAVLVRPEGQWDRPGGLEAGRTS
jgi:predicted GNAT family N-acyltransferase